MDTTPHNDETEPRRRFSRRSVLRMSALGASAGAVGIAGFGAGRATAAGAELPDWTAGDIPPQHGRRVVVTGGNRYPRDGRSGLGYHQALGLARAGADVTIASRDRVRGEEAVRRISAAAPGAAVRFETLDLTSLASISAFATRMSAAGDRLDLLINNAGVMARTHREVSADGFERTFATNALGPFVLSARLRPLLQNGTDPRIIWMGSLRGHTGSINFDDLQKEREYDYVRAYDDTKLANLLLAFECERRSKAAGWRITSIAAHPGTARTNIVLDGPGPDTTEGMRFRYILPMWQDPAQGALPILYAATSPQATGGGYYGPKGFQSLRGLPGMTVVPENARDPQLGATLWTTLERLGNVSFG
ncbi:NAD(P)-dependent dehydrogenase (short-subunit alcohol dehydrogenase family) [Catenuloplanes nepalensis]|uniref:NAD(P)-dependent dehydrogenase (Short-subunit alcohol dehydrogenase family) n=1 Tax=Catenuloplanes nepalensis TaxID=587533 RepID=A0ABT9MXF8_9ACTN|nr:oxidoreductase [Catenuloplanes nepalensis]MDP9796108.1 NAD(P)-dependent dehydrogenase (short-subunit alcohol dehydrogenase family) [Catenuloplanes nepalensis]